MGRKIDEDTIIQINKLYLELGVKKRVAEIVGVSPSTVSKYIIPDFKIEPEIEEKIDFNKPIRGAEYFIKQIQRINSNGDYHAALCKICNLTQKEWKKMAEIQKGVNI